MASAFGLATTLELRNMRLAKSILEVAAVAAFCLAAFAADDTAIPPVLSCGNGVPGGIECITSKRDLKDAHRAFDRGMKFNEQRQFEDALVQFEDASRLAPREAKYLTAREMVKAQLVFNHVQRGNEFLIRDARMQAAMEFHKAIELDPANEFARERLKEATREWAAPVVAARPWQTRLSESTEIHIEPKIERASLHFNGDVRTLFTQLATAYGITVQFDDSVQGGRRLRFNVDDVDFHTAVTLACQATKTMWGALDARQLLIASDSAENHRHYDRMSLRTLILPPHSTPQQATEFVTTMRNVFDLRYISSGLTADTVELRGSPAVLEACAQLLEELGRDRPEVVFDINVYQISRQLAHDIGLHVPNTFNLFNIPAVALAGLGGQNVGDLINQLISSGGINQAGNSALSGLLSQLGGQGNSIFSQPLATFGGGLTFSGLSLDKLSAALSLNESSVRNLEHMTLRASQGNDATFHLGERFPIQNASYAPIYNSPQISKVLGNQSYIPPFPSVTYEDLGLQVKVKPAIHGDNSVSLQLELQLKSLTGQSNDGVPILSNREYKGAIRLQDGEPAFIAGELSETDTYSMTGLPILNAIPGLNLAAVNHTKQDSYNELMIAITPHIVSNYDRSTSEIWLTDLGKTP